jgi:hypothetical protein
MNHQRWILHITELDYKYTSHGCPDLSAQKTVHWLMKCFKQTSNHCSFAQSPESFPALHRSKKPSVAASCKVRYLIQKPGQRWKRITALYESRWSSVVWAWTHVSRGRAMVCVWRWRTRTKVSVVASMRKLMRQEWMDGMWGWCWQWVVKVACSISKVQLQLLLVLQLQRAKWCRCHGNIWHDVRQVAITTRAALGLQVISVSISTHKNCYPYTIKSIYSRERTKKH